MRRRDDADVASDRHVVADTLEYTLLQHPQELYLHRGAHVADLIEEQRAAFGDLEAALAGGDRAGEGALLVAEELGLEQLGRNGAAVDRDEGALAPRAQVVDGVRGDFLAGAGLAEDEDGGVVVGDLADQGDDFTDREGGSGRQPRRGGRGYLGRRALVFARCEGRETLRCRH